MDRPELVEPLCDIEAGKGYPLWPQYSLVWGVGAGVS